MLRVPLQEIARAALLRRCPFSLASSTRMFYRLFGAALLAAVLLLPLPGYGQVSDTTQGAEQGAPAPSATVLRLEALLRAAEAQNPSLEASRLQARALAERPAQVSALPDPVGGAVYQPRPVVTARGTQRAQFRLEQQIPFPGKRRLRGEVAALEADVAASETGALGQDLALGIKRAYYDLYRAGEQTRIVRAFQEELRGFEDAAATRYEVGTGSQQAILKAQIERQRLDVRLEALAAERTSALQTLARLTGRTDLDGAAGRVQAAPPPVEEAGALVDAALEARPEAEALRRSIARAGRAAALARREFLPDFTVGLTYFDIAETSLTPTMTGRDAVALSVGVKVPLWLGKQRARLEEAQIERRRAETRLGALRLEIETRLADLRSQLARQERQLALLGETLLPQARTTLEATLSAYTTGRADFLDLLDAERTLFQLRMDYEATYARYLTTAAELERALGRAALPDGP